MTKKNTLIFIILTVLLTICFVIDLAVGPVRIPLSALFNADGSIANHIMLHIRLPKAITAILAGAGLSVAGLMMQTLFRNPLAGPYILGVSSGATLGVACVVLMGSVLGFACSGAISTIAAIVGATAILLAVMLIARRMESNVSLLIVGMMIGSVAGALVNVMQNYANPDSLKMFVVWTLGSLSSVSWTELTWLIPIFALGLLISIYLMKAMNGLLLGENYAQGLGINMRQTRLLLTISTGLLAGSVTAFCGPIAFIGVAVPHIARGVLRTNNHRLALPACALIGADMLLLCDAIANGFTYPLPISTVSALFGAPIIIAIILKKH